MKHYMKNLVASVLAIAVMSFGAMEAIADKIKGSWNLYPAYSAEVGCSLA